MQLVSLIKKIKATCDSIKGGESNVKFKVFNHQIYAYDYHPHSYDIHKQNIRRQLMSDAFYTAITNSANGISGYVDFIDTACRFDWETGYTPIDVSTNLRVEGHNDVSTSNDGMHMNKIGCYNYADVLIDDFLCDADFD